MEEDIKILEDEIVALNVGHERYDEAVQNLLKAYKQDEKMIDLILDKFIEGTEYYFSEFDYMDKKDIKEYFRKKVENE